MADGPLPVGADHAADGRSLVPANGRVDGAGGRLRTAHAHGPVFPGKAIRVEGAPQAVMDIAAFGHGHEAGGALVQPIHHMKDKVRPPLIGQRSRYGGGIRQEIGGVGRHAGGLVEDQQVLILIDDGQGPVSRRGEELGRAQIVRPHRHHIPGMDRVHRPGVDAVDPDAVFRTGEPGYGVGGEVELRLQNVPNADAVLLRRHGVGDNLHQLFAR